MIKKKSIVITQYPILGINNIFKFYAKLLKLKGCRIACIIHDIEALRTEKSSANILKEITALNAYDAVIAHNYFMKEWLLQNGFKGYVTEIILFDYLVKETNSEFNLEEHKYNSQQITVAFAGNLGLLGKSKFLKKLGANKNEFNINLYGPGYNKELMTDEKIEWLGSFSPDAIINNLYGDFGLIWDGDSLDDITGLMGNYLKYNSPHKTSLYLVAGLPVIIPEEAAIAGFIVENGLGISIKMLSDISQIVKQVDNISYKKMKANVHLIQEKLKRGNYFLSAVKNIEAYLFKNAA